MIHVTHGTIGHKKHTSCIKLPCNSRQETQEIHVYDYLSLTVALTMLTEDHIMACVKVIMRPGYLNVHVCMTLRANISQCAWLPAQGYFTVHDILAHRTQSACRWTRPRSHGPRLIEREPEAVVITLDPLSFLSFLSFLMHGYLWTV